MREIKFRAWDNVDYMSTPFTLQDLQLKKVQFTADCQIMQYTGMKDVGGKEIYEGDVVENKKEAMRGVYEFKTGGFGIKGTCTIQNFGAKVIGNIYENPELIKSILSDK